MFDFLSFINITIKPLDRFTDSKNYFEKIYSVKH